MWIALPVRSAERLRTRDLIEWEIPRRMQEITILEKKSKKTNDKLTLKIGKNIKMI